MNIAIWGAGKFGQYIFSQLKANNDMQVCCFIDSKIQENGLCQGIEAVSPEVYMRHYDFKTDVVLVAFLDGITILKQLRNLGIKKFGFIHKRVYRLKLPLQHSLERDSNILWSDDEELKKPCLETLETNVVDYCNMNCKGCSHFSNLFPKGSGVPFEIFERDIKQLSKKVFVSQFNLLGGEVFLSDRLVDYIACLKNYMPKTKIELVSNGVLIPRQEKKIFECIRENEVTISITEYPPTSAVLEKIIDTLDQNHIMYYIRPLVETFGKNIDLSGNNDPIKAMVSCRESTCQFLRDGKIYKCPFSALGNYYFNFFNIPQRSNEGYDIFDENRDWMSLAENIRKEPIALCQYCGREEQFAWEISNNPDKNEWLISNLNG